MHLGLVGVRGGKGGEIVVETARRRYVARVAVMRDEIDRRHRPQHSLDGIIGRRLIEQTQRGVGGKIHTRPRKKFPHSN